MGNCKIGKTYPSSRRRNNYRYAGVACKGDFKLGTACGKCKKCKAQIDNIEYTEINNLKQ